MRTKAKLGGLLALVIVLLTSTPAGAERRRDFNRYIVKAVELIYRHHKGEGYQAGAYFTHSLYYAKRGEITRSPGSPSTMCVAAVAQVIIGALRLYADETHDESVFQALPARLWNRGTRGSLRSYLFMYKETHSLGTAYALEKFGLGEQLAFKDLVAGDFINLNRTNGSGHAVVFMGFLNRQGKIEPVYDAERVAGFRYFSAQGTRPGEAGFGYRWAFFGACPAWKEAGKPRDCGVRLPTDGRILNAGYMLDPSLWTIAEARRKMLDKQRGAIFQRRVGRLPNAQDMVEISPRDRVSIEASAVRELEEPVDATSTLLFDGATTDDE
jgi:hypothetical protein